ncbi:hypothetical protein KW796_00640 [Candidatus Parcubacteria bacterium]|nr:hypothetical protein [Candidatus Parcubacteria bacterium]
MHNIIRKFKKSLDHSSREINPEDIFIDSANLPGLNRDRFEGRMERPIGERTFFFFKIFLAIVIVSLAGKLWGLQVKDGKVYAEVSENNRLDRTIVFADRGVIYDRNKLPLAENSIKPGEEDFAGRKYAPIQGLAAVLGYVKFPQKDSSGRYYDESYHGQAGVEKIYDYQLSGVNGSKLIESDARGEITSESIVESPRKGLDLTLAIDARLTEELYKAISAAAKLRGFTGGAAVIMDTETGEILALTSYPEYDPSVVTAGTDKEEIKRLLNDKSKPFLNRAVSGLYTPGSIVKPIVALGALSEDVIDPGKSILSTGALTLPNPYDPAHPSVFKDWKAHGWVNMREALAVSSDVYFYEVGGGFQNQPGLGITKLDKYFSLFGMTEKTGIDLPAEGEGYIANPEWKERTFPEDPVWRIGNTYHTAIGQYGTQVTPVAAARWTAALANGGTLLVPTVVKGGHSEDKRVLRKIDLPEGDWEIVREGMYQSVHGGVASGLSTPEVQIAAKTGTAELGVHKEFVNSWVTGFFPYKNPRYAFALIMEKGPVANLVGATSVMRQVIDWMTLNTPEYLLN